MYLANVAGAINLQATLSASSAGLEVVQPHHPITCSGELEYDFEAGEFRCPHAGVPMSDVRTRHCLDHSVALLIIELAVKKYG
jgi:predicted RNA-binding Zn-ribbon protein involved in translation (DUF1610 family)